MNLSLKAFFPPSGLNLGERLRAGLASGPKFLRGRSPRDASAAPGSPKSGLGLRMGPPMGRGGPGGGRNPPGGRGLASRARASFTARGRPLNGWLLNWRMASWACCSSANSTKANPRFLPVSRSSGIDTYERFPTDEKCALISPSVAS